MEADKKNSNIYGFVFAGIAIIAFIALIIVFVTRSQADTTTQNLTVQNLAPTIDTLVFSTSSFGSAASTFNLTESTTTTGYIHGTYTDTNGCSQVTAGTVDADFFKSTLTKSCTGDNNDCYNIVGASNCTISNCSGGSDTTGSFECTVAVQFYADGTDVGSASSAANWVADVALGDGTTTSPSSQTTTEMASLLAHSISSPINYGTVALGAQSSEQVVDVTQTGNTAFDLQVQVDQAMACTVGTIPTANVEWSLTPSFSFGTGFSPSTTPATFQYNMGLRTSDSTNLIKAFRAKLQNPASGVSGSCTNIATTTAIADT